MNEWQEVPLGVLGRVVTGKTPPAARPDAFGGEFPFVTPTDMVDQRFMVRTDRYLSNVGSEMLRRLIIPAGSLMVSCIGWQLGKVSVATTDSYTNQQINSVIPDSSKVHPGYLYYHLRTRRDELKRLASGGTRTPILNKSRFSALGVPLPPRRVQEGIADVLSTFDDLIESEGRRIEVMEEMISRVYHEWFVEFRYPGHQGASRVASAVGAIPAGWDVGYLGEPLPFRQFKQKIRHYEGTRRYLATADVAGLHVKGEGVLLEYSSLPSRAQLQPADSTVFTARMSGYRKVLLYPIGSNEAASDVLSSGFLGVECDAGYFSYIAATVSDLRFESLITRYATGATQISLTDAGARLIPWVVPPSAVVARFECFAAPIYSQILQLRSLVVYLSRLRDLVLSRLMTGQIDVSTLDLDALIAEQVA